MTAAPSNSAIGLTGMAWHGRRVLQGAVIYVALERAKLVKRRALALREKHKFKGLPFAVVGRAINFRDPKAIDKVLATVRKVEERTGQKVILIILDTINRALCGGDENSSKDMGELIASVGRIQDSIQAAILALHHMPHDANRMRGHGSLLGAVDSSVAVQKTETCRTATVVKANDAHEGEQVAFTLESVGLPSGTQAPLVVPIHLEPHQSASFPESIRLNLNQRRFVGILRTAIAEIPVTHGAMGVPDRVQAVTRENLKKYLVVKGWMEEAESGNGRAKVSNMLNALAEKKLVGLANQCVWIRP